MLQNVSPLSSTLPGIDLDAWHEAPKPRLLIIDDDEDFVSMMKLVLRQANFDVSSAGDYHTAITKCMEIKPDIILLDIMMPEVDGHQIFPMLRKITQAPVLFVSAAPRAINLVKALDAGAEDYISKPFENSEMIARLRKALRQVRSANATNAFYFPEVDLHINLETREVTLKGQRVHLLPREFSLLTLLAENAPHNVPYEKITTHMWGEDSPKTRAHLKTVAFALRRKLSTEDNRSLIVNNRCNGYQLLTER